MHSYAAHLMNTYGEQYILVESDDELGINIRYRWLQVWITVNCRLDEMELSIGWSFGVDW